MESRLKSALDQIFVQTFDETTNEVFIPNQEVAQEFLNVEDEPGWDGVIQALRRSEELLRSTSVFDCEMCEG